MKYEKDYIIKEIIRTAEENNNEPLGKGRFHSETGIKEGDWYGRYWTKWSDALLEAGYKANQFGEDQYEAEFLISRLIDLIKELDKFPTVGEISMKKHRDRTFPSLTTYRRLGKTHELAQKVVEYCKGKEELTDVAKICLSLCQIKEENAVDKPESLSENFGFVYLMKSGKYYKIGRSNDADRRVYELRIQMPEKLELIHKIKTDDPIGIEEYWHKRFKDKRKNGEWFELTKQDVEIFKRKKFM